jgi:hypothetical protein
MDHTWRLERRKAILLKILDPTKLERVWKEYLKDGFRQQHISDLHDYNDWNNNRKIEFRKIISDVTSGSYRARRAFYYTTEKKLGVYRRIAIPSVKDAIILQAFVEFFLPFAVSRQPSHNAFFSRSHGKKTDRPDIESDPIYPWFIAWRRMANKRAISISRHKYLVVTDIANYFDNIRLDQLRNIVSSVCDFGSPGSGEVFLDLVIETLNELSWVPDYLPRNHEGLVQVDFDAPRLFSHVYLYEIDEFLKLNNDDLFLRWVDDISFPGDDVEHLKDLIGRLDDILYSRGCRLNISKTQILTAEQAHAYFWIEENVQIDRLNELHSLDPRTIGRIRLSIRKFFSNRDLQFGQWNKIVARYISLLTKHHANLGISLAQKLLAESLPLKRKLFLNFVATGFSRRKLSLLIKALRGQKRRCDETTFGAWQVFSTWSNIPPTSIPAYARAVHRLGRSHMRDSERCSHAALLGYLRFSLVYGDDRTIVAICRLILRRFPDNEFLVRQAAAALAHFPRHSDPHKELINILSKISPEISSSIISNVDLMHEKSTSFPNLKAYILPPSLKHPYSLERFLIARACARSPSVSAAQRKSILASMIAHKCNPKLLAEWVWEFGP